MIDTLSDFAAAAADFGPAVATLGGAPIAGVLRQPAEVALGIVGGAEPEFHITGGTVPEDPRAVQLVVDGRTWNVRDWRDDEGVVVLSLESAT